MEKRVKFKPGDQKRWIEKVMKASSLSIKELAAVAKIHPRSFRDWKNEKLAMSFFAMNLFCKKFNIEPPERKEVLIKRWLEARKKRNRIGGIARFKKYGNPGTEEGRKKGGLNSIKKLRESRKIPIAKIYNIPSRSVSLAEFVGIMLGDGGITTSQCTITLNSISDIDYISFVSNLANQLFGEKPKTFKKRDCNAVVLYYNSVFLTRYFCSIGLVVGNKVKQQVGVPEWITTNLEYKIACLRGLMDTDGGVFLHRYLVNGKKYVYKKISFSNRSLPLLNFVYETLSELGFAPKIINKVENKKVWLYNESEINRYLKEIGSNNKRLLKYGG